MRARSLPALAAVAILALTAACGGGDEGGSALSEDEFVDELADICGDAERDIDRIDEPTGDDFSQAAGEAVEVYNDTIARLQDITPPERSADDLEAFIGNLEDQSRQFERLAEANGAEEADPIFERLFDLSEEQSEIAQDLDVEECDPNAGGSTETTVAETTPPTVPATTAAPTTAAPVTTAAPITLPTTVAPAPPATEAPVGPSFEIIDLTAEGFVAPDGFYLTPKTPDQGTLDLIASLPELDEKLLQLGVATLVESGSDLEIADIWLGLSETDSMPADWKTLDCPSGGDLRTSQNGILGIVCLAALESPFWEIFTATDADIGISVYTRVSDISGDLVADAFLAAN